jgi:hypothetical protein
MHGFSHSVKLNAAGTTTVLLDSGTRSPAAISSCKETIPGPGYDEMNQHNNKTTAQQ